MKRGAYIVIEGGEGAGKDTHVAKLQELLADRHAVFTREPGGTRLGKTLREMLLHKSHGDVSLPAELFLFLADRAQNVDEVVKPALAKGAVVVSNRSWLSFLAYQIYGREQLEWRPLVEQAIEKIYTDAKADLIVVLDVPQDVGQERQRAMGKTQDSIEGETRDMHARIRNAYLSIARTLPEAVVIDANRPLEAVWEDVKSAVLKVLE